jgi:putative glutamine amidotransferase
LGGTLRRDTSASDALIRHHAPDDVDFDAMFDHRHPVELADGGMLSNAYAKGALDVNSVHFQGIGTLADGLTVEARAPDGLIEAYSADPMAPPCWRSSGIPNGARKMTRIRKPISTFWERR